MDWGLLENSFAGKDVEVVIDGEFNSGQQCASAVKAANQL